MSAFNPFSRTDLSKPEPIRSGGLMGLLKQGLKQASEEFLAAYEKEMSSAMLPETRKLLPQPPENLRKYLQQEEKPDKSFEVMA